MSLRRFKHVLCSASLAALIRHRFVTLLFTVFKYMAGCTIYATATQDFPGGVPVRESCINPKTGQPYTAWYFAALYSYHGVKWGITIACGFLGYKFKRLFRIGSAAFAGAREIQVTAITAWTWYIKGSRPDLELDSQEGTAGANLAILYFLMLIGMIVQWSLKDLEAAVDETESAGHKRAKLRITMHELQQDIQELRSNAREQIQTLEEEHRDDPKYLADEKAQIEKVRDAQIQVINVQLDSLKVAAKVAEEKVTHLDT